MRGLAIGRVDGVESYVSKKTDAVVFNVSVASKGTMLNVRTPDGEEFREDDVVCVVGRFRGGTGGAIYPKGAALVKLSADEQALLSKLLASADIVAAVDDETEG